MTSRSRRLLGAALAGVVAAGLAVAGTTSPASAITGGIDDEEGLYPNVGIIAFYDAAGDRYRCSATLVTPTVLLTAAHCTDGTVGKTAVSFAPRIAETADTNTVPRAAKPSAGFTPADIARSAGFLSGTAFTHPKYSGFTDLANWNDTGVVVLDTAVNGIQPAAVAPLGTLSSIPKPQFTKTLFRMVGYGTEVRQAPTGKQKPTPQSFPIRRQYVDAQAQKLSAQVFQVNANENDPFGGGGTCFGDSGGPALLDGKIVGVTSYGYTSNCRYIDGYQRIDIAASQDWLKTFGITPASK